MKQLTCQFFSPSQQSTVSHIDLIVLPGEEGELGILPRHAPIIVALKSGIVRIYRKEDVFQNYFIEKGFVLFRNFECTITSSSFSLLDELDPKVLEADIKRYHNDLVGLTIEDDQRFIQAQILLTEAMLDAWHKQRQVRHP